MAPSTYASPVGTGADSPNGVDFINGNTAWFTLQPITQSDTFKPFLMLYHTSDGGRTWRSVKIILHTQMPVYQTEISVTNSAVMYMDMIPEHGMNSMPGQLIVSHDGGEAWTTVKTPDSIPFGGALEFVNSATGWLSTSNTTTTNQRLYETTNGGTVWREIHVPVPKPFTGDGISLSMPQFSATDPSEGILQVRFQNQKDGDEHNVIYSTKDSGRSWVFVGDMPGQAGWVSFPNTSVGIDIPLTSS